MAETRRQREASAPCLPGDEHWPEHLEAAQRRAFIQTFQTQVTDYEQRYPRR